MGGCEDWREGVEEDWVVEGGRRLGWWKEIWGVESKVGGELAWEGGRVVCVGGGERN